MECDWILFTTNFALPVVAGGAVIQVLVQTMGAYFNTQEQKKGA